MGCGASREERAEATSEEVSASGTHPYPQEQAADDIDPLLTADVARIEAELLEPLPEGSTCREPRGGDEIVCDIEPLLAYIQALVYAQENGTTTQSDTLILVANQLTDAAMPPLVEAIEAGAMPALKTLALQENRLLGDTGLAALRPLLAGRLSGRLVDFGFGSQLTIEEGLGGWAPWLSSWLADGRELA